MARCLPTGLQVVPSEGGNRIVVTLPECVSKDDNIANKQHEYIANQLQCQLGEDFEPTKASILRVLN